MFANLRAALLIGPLLQPAPAQPQVPDWTVSEVASVEIGGEDPRPAYQMFRVSAAFRLADGTIVVANAGTLELRYYSPEGVHLATAGGRGQGPGEFRALVHATRMENGDVGALSIDAVSRFAPDGSYLGMERLDLWGVSPPCRIAEGGWSLLPTGDVLFEFDENHGPPGCPPLSPGPRRSTGLVALWDRAEQRLDSLFLLPSTERNGPLFRVFGALLLVAPSEQFVYGFDTGSSAIARADRRTGEVVYLPAPWTRRPVPSAARRVRERIGVQMDRARGITPVYNYPDRLPAAGRMLVDADGFLWVSEFPQTDGPLDSIRLKYAFTSNAFRGAHNWKILTPDGEVVGTATTPAGLHVTDIGPDYVLGISVDDVGLETIQMHSLHRSAAR